MSVFSVQTYDNDALVRNYIPCINSDGMPRLYDSVNGNFIGNSSLKAGPAV